MVGGDTTLEFVVSLAQRFFGLLALGDVYEDVDGAEQAAGVVANGVDMGEDGEAAAVGALDDDLA